MQVTLELTEVKNHLRVEHDLDDGLIQRFLKSATEEVANYLNRDFEGEEVPAEIEIWILNRVATYYENRQGNIPKPDFSPVQTYRRYPMASEVELDEDS